MGGVKDSLTSLAGQVITSGAILGGFSKALDFVVSSASDAQTEQVRLEAILKATGSAAGMSATELFGLATELSNMSGVEDETIIGAESILLTFKEIGSNIFPDVTRAALDLSATFKMDLQSAATMLGKAMEDPIVGMTTLRRMGIFLSDQQQKQVKDFMAVNDVASAQGIILDVVKGKVGGVAEAMGDTFQGNLNKVKTSFGNIAEILGGPVVSGVGAALDGFAGLLQTIVELNTETEKGPPDWDKYTAAVDASTPVHEEAGRVMGIVDTNAGNLRDTLWNSIKPWDGVTASAGKAADAIGRTAVAIIDVSKASFGKEALDNLSQAYEKGLIPEDEYYLQTVKIMEGLMGMEPAAITAAIEMDTLTDKFNAGKISPAEYAAAVQTLYDKITALDGKTADTYVTNHITDDYQTPFNPTHKPPAEQSQSGIENFIVPSGYPNDSFPFRVSSGEVVNVTSALEAGKGGKGGDNYYITITGNRNGFEAYRQFKEALESDLRAEERAGIQYSDY